MENENINNLLLNAISSVQEKNNKNKEKIEVLSKTAKVINYDETNYTATVYMIDDQEQNEYILYNKSGEILSENDSVRVFYTTSVSKGWIGMRLGEPVVKEFEYIPYVSKKIYNTIESELGITEDSVFSLDFNVESAESDVVLSANQIINTTTEGTFACTYEVDGEQQTFMPQQILSTGKNLIPHIVPMPLAKGGHNVLVKMSSPNARGLTAEGNFYGVISGMISGVSIVTPPNYKFKFGFEGVPDGYSLTIPALNINSTIIGLIDWGDGVSEDYTANISKTHIYITGGEYEVKITVALNSVYNNNGLFTGNIYIKSAIFPDNMVSFVAQQSFLNCTNLSKVILGNSIVIMTGSYIFLNTPKLHNLFLPETLTTLEARGTLSQSSFYTLTIPKNVINFSIQGELLRWCSSLTKLTLDCDVLQNYMVMDCILLNNVIFNGNIEIITSKCFYGCSSLNNVILPISLITIKTEAFRNCISLSNVVIPPSVKKIETSAFANTSLTSVTIASDCVYQANSFPSGCVINYY